MARRKKSSGGKRSYFFAKKRRSSGSGSYGLLGTLVGAALYGAVRQRASMAVQPITQNLPFGNISDEIALGGSALLLDKFVGAKMPILRPFLKGAVVVEGARIGEAIATNSVYSTSTPSGYMLG